MSININVIPSDEWMYLWMAKMTSLGKSPYQDFNFSHPPVHLIPAALIYLLSPDALVSCKSIPIICTAASGTILYASLRRFGIPAALGFLFMFYTSDVVLFLGSYFIGIEIGLLLLCAGMTLLFHGKQVIGGMALSISLMSSTLVGIAACCLVLGIVLVRRRHSMKTVAAFSITTMSLIAVFIALWGWEFIEQVYVVPFSRPTEFVQKSRLTEVFTPFIISNIALLSAALPGMYSAFKTLDTPEAGVAWLTRASAIALIMTLVFFVVFPSIHFFYLIILLPLALVPAAHGLGHLLHRQTLPRTLQLMLGAWMLIGFTVACINTYSYIERAEGNQALSAALEPVSLWLANEIGPDNTIFGDSTLAPLIALKHDIPLWHLMADTNTKRFSSDHETVDALIEELASDPPDALLFVQNHGIFAIPEVKEFAVANYPPPRIIIPNPLYRILLFEHAD